MIPGVWVMTRLDRSDSVKSMATLSDLSREIAELVGRLAPSVVRVDARRGRPGTGIIWAENLVLTADHVIAEETIQVIGTSATVKASVVGRDPGTDLALLRTEGLKGTPAPRGRAADVRPGQIVLALGGQGADLQVTFGIVSGLSGSFRSWRGAQVDGLIQTTAELLPGFSGGPLVDAEGRVIGINSWNFGQGVSRAIPVETADKVAESLQTHGRIRRAYLGLGAQPVRLNDALANQLGQAGGLLVVTVEPDGPAARAGLMQGDTIVSIDSSPIHQLDELFGTLRSLQVGSAHQFRVVRAGELKDVTVTVGERQG